MNGVTLEVVDRSGNPAGHGSSSLRWFYLTNPNAGHLYHANEPHEPSILGGGRFRFLRIGSVMIGLELYAMQRSTSNTKDPDSIREKLRRSMVKSECELCESHRYTDVKYGMEVCHVCQLEYLPVADRRSY